MAGDSEIKRYTRSGVPVLTLPAQDGLCRAGIVFRAGFADEPLPKRGVCHLIEHTVCDLAPDTINANALTQQLFTGFYAAGKPAVVHRFLETVCADLRDFPRDRLERERRILTVEDLSPGGPGTANRLKYLRCGPTGFGSRSEHEHGVWNMSDDEVVGWANEYFTADNCIAFLTGVPPKSLDLSLPAGKRMPPPAFRQLAHVVTPAQVDDAYEEVAVACVAPYGTPRNLVVDAVCNRVVEALRIERGVIYDVETDNDQIDADRSHSCFRVDGFGSDSAVVRDAIFAALSGLARGGATETEHRRFVRDHGEMVASYEAIAELDDAAEDELLGRTYLTPKEHLRRAKLVEKADVAAAARQMIDTVIVSVTEGTPLPGWANTRVRAIEDPEFEPVDGTIIPGRRRLLGLLKGREHIVFGEDAIAAVGDETDPPMVSVRDSDVVLAIRHASGDLTLKRADDYWIRLDASIDRCRSAIDELLERLDPSVIVDSAHRVQLRRVRDAVAEPILDERILGAAAVNAAEELTATESIHHVVKAEWDDHEGLMVLTDRRVILGGREEEETGSKPWSEFRGGRSDDGKLVLTDADGGDTAFAIYPQSEITSMVATIDSLRTSESIEFF